MKKKYLALSLLGCGLAQLNSTTPPMRGAARFEESSARLASWPTPAIRVRDREKEDASSSQRAPSLPFRLVRSEAEDPEINRIFGGSHRVVEKFAKELKSLHDQDTEFGRRVSILEGLIVKQQAQNRDLQAQYLEISERNQALSHRLAKLEGKCSELNEEKTILLNKFEQISTIQNWCQDLQRVLEEYKHGSSEIKNYLGSVRTEMQLLRNDVDSIKNAINILPVSLKAELANIHHLERRISVIVEECERIRELEQRVTAIVKECETWRDQHAPDAPSPTVPVLSKPVIPALPVQTVQAQPTEAMTGRMRIVEYRAVGAPMYSRTNIHHSPDSGTPRYSSPQIRKSHSEMTLRSPVQSPQNAGTSSMQTCFTPQVRGLSGTKGYY